MGGKRSGRRTKPSAVKKVEGNRGRRALNKREPVPPTGQPVMPIGLSPRAQTFWQELLPILEAMNVMRVSDAQALGHLCMALDRRMQAEEAIQKFGIMIPQKNEVGIVIGVKMNPAVRVASDAERHIRSWSAAFGLDPASRSGLTVNDSPENIGDPLEAVRRAKTASDIVQ
jgi:P27 family predicted phage terminase small subunit